MPQLPTATRQQKVGKLLHIIPTRGAKAFPELISALVATQQEHLADKLDLDLSQHFKNVHGSDQQETTEVDYATPSNVVMKSVGEKVAEIRMLFDILAFIFIF